jgi:hypothetical protein
MGQGAGLARMINGDVDDPDFKSCENPARIVDQRSGFRKSAPPEHQ